MYNIEVKNLEKSINGDVILNNINLSLDGGNIYGFIGKNGSGKTMLFRIIAGLVKPSKGNVFLEGEKIGVVIENASLFPDFTGFKNLMFLAKINNYIGEKEVRDAIESVGLDPNDKRTINKYSLGMRQRIAIAQAIMEEPHFLLLDEPTNALDENGVILIRNIIKKQAERGAVVLIASHNSKDIEQLCDKIMYLSNGTIKEEKY